MSVPEEKIRREFEDLAARALESGLGLADVDRLHHLLDTHPSLEPEWDAILRTTLLLRDAGLTSDDFPVKEGVPVRTRQPQLPGRRFHEWSRSAMAAAATVLVISAATVVWFFVRPSMQQPPGVLPTSEVVSIEGLCYHRSGYMKERSPVPEASAAERGSRCRFRFFYENEVTVDFLGPGRLSYSTQPSRLALEPHAGTVLVRSRHLGPGGHLSVITGPLRIDSLGTIFRVEIQEGGQVKVDVAEGEVLLSPLRSPTVDGEGQRIPVPLKAGESWSGSADSHALHGSSSSLTSAERERLDALLKGGPEGPGAPEGVLLQTLTTTDGKRYTGTVDQTDHGYRIHTADGVLYFAASDVKQIDIRIQGEKEPLPQESPP